MASFKELIKPPLAYVKALFKWLLLSALVGGIGGTIGSLFHITIDVVTEIRQENWWILLFLPLGGLCIVFLYGLFRKNGRIDTNRVLESARDEESVPFVMAPLIFISTCITHFLGGSAGREGAALQLGGSLGYKLGKVFRLKKEDMHTIVMAGMSAVFAALFGTPLTAAFFALEVTRVGILHYGSLVPCLAASVTAYKIAALFGLSPVRFTLAPMADLSFPFLGQVLLLALLCALVSILFCTAIKKTEHYMEKWISNPYLRALTGGIIVMGLPFLLKTFDYNGAGMEVINRAMSGEASYEAFVLKILMTAITIAAGFKGGEIVPSFFIGATFGCAFSPFLGLAPELGAAIGFVALFCGVVNCPVASLLLAVEVFGGNFALPLALACGISYMMSGCFGLYHSQEIVFSKLSEEEINTLTH